MGVTDDLADGIDEIAELLSSVAADIAKVEEVRGHLSNYRSIVIEFDNHTSLSLNWQEPASFSHGGFDTLPNDNISPHTADIFGVQSKGCSVNTGVEGSMIYNAGELVSTIHFNNPAEGSNDAYIVLSGPDTITSKFRVRCLIGAGNQGAHLRYQLNRHADYSLRKWLADHNVLLQDPNQPPSFTNDGVKIALPRSGRNLPPPGQAFSLRIFFDKRW